MTKLKLQNTMYLTVKESNSDNEWIDAEANAEAFAEVGETVIVGEYRLIRKLKLKTESKTEVLPVKR
jgi:hypothetical protein